MTQQLIKTSDMLNRT